MEEREALQTRLWEVADTAVCCTLYLDDAGRGWRTASVRTEWEKGWGWTVGKARSKSKLCGVRWEKGRSASLFSGGLLWYLVCYLNRTTSNPSPLPLVQQCGLQEDRVMGSNTVWEGTKRGRDVEVRPWAFPFWKGLSALAVPPYAEQKQASPEGDTESKWHCNESGQLDAYESAEGRDYRHQHIPEGMRIQNLLM